MTRMRTSKIQLTVAPPPEDTKGMEALMENTKSGAGVWMLI